MEKEEGSMVCFLGVLREETMKVSYFIFGDWWNVCVDCQKIYSEYLQFLKHK